MDKLPTTGDTPGKCYEPPVSLPPGETWRRYDAYLAEIIPGYKEAREKMKKKIRIQGLEQENAELKHRIKELEAAIFDPCRIRAVAGEFGTDKRIIHVEPLPKQQPICMATAAQLPRKVEFEMKCDNPNFCAVVFGTDC